MERDIQVEIVAMIAREFADRITIWRNNTGVATHATGGRVVYGIGRGGADLVGIVAPTGRMIAIEVKTERGRVSPEQRAWIAHVVAMGGIAGVCRTVEEARDLCRRATTTIG